MNLKRNNGFDYYRVATGLLYNALRFRVYKLINKPLKPAAVSLAVTNRCNSHCIMCNIWKSAAENPGIKKPELSGSKIISILYSRLFSELVELDLTGGEPHLRDDLADIVLGIVRLKNNNLTRLRSIVITSNGFLTRRIITNSREILSSLKDTEIDLVAVISLDGIGDVHDTIRGTGGAFKMVSGTLSELAELRREYPNFIPGIKTTILPQNVDVLDDILDYALANNLFHIISPVIFTESRFKNTDRKDEISLSPSGLQKVADFYRRKELQASYLYVKSLNYLTAGKKQWVCTALRNYLFIDYDGRVYPCEMIPETIGDVTKQDIKDIWNSRLAGDWRKRIEKMERCRVCHEPGAIRYSAAAEGLSYRKFLTGLGRKRYAASWYGEGYSKYRN